MNRIRTIDDAYAYLTIQAIEAGYDFPEIDAENGIVDEINFMLN
jgi:hypothetical protein